MYKFITTIASVLVGLAFAGSVFAVVPNVSVRTEQPKSPTNINNLKIAVVALDRLGRVVIVRCFKKAPSDVGFVQFGGDIATSPGGNSVTCDTNSTIMPNDNTYFFQATADAGDGPETSNTVSVVYNTSGPGTPTSYSKSRVNVCDYKIDFHTADDAGKTVKVEVYRSNNTSFDLNAGTRVDTVFIGSNVNGSSTTTPPNCSTEYYFAIRAFDSAGNGSNSIGDSVVHITNVPSSTGGTSGGSSGAAGGAIPAGSNGNILGQSTGPTGGATGTDGTVMGDATPSAATPEVVQVDASQPFPTKTILIIGGIVLLLLGAWFMRKK